MINLNIENKKYFKNFIELIIGFSFFKFLSGEKCGQNTNLFKLTGICFTDSLKITLNNSTIIHLHHWILLTIIIYFKPSLMYFCLGGIIQGLTYNDWYQIIYVKKF